MKKTHSVQHHNWLQRLWSRCKPSGSNRPARQRHGKEAERLACAYLRRGGYEIEATNVRYPIGEVDIVAQDQGILCMVEVRSKTSDQFGSATESITFKKRQRLIKAAHWYLQARRPRWEGNVRFDVVAIEFRSSGEPKIELLRNAFDAEPFATA